MADTHFSIPDGMGDWTIRRLVKEGVTLIVECMDCPYQAAWTTADIESRFSQTPHRTLKAIAMRAKCTRCRRQHVRFWCAAPGFAPPDST